MTIGAEGMEGYRSTGYGGLQEHRVWRATGAQGADDHRSTSVHGGGPQAHAQQAAHSAKQGRPVKRCRRLSQLGLHFPCLGLQIGACCK